MPGRLTYGYVKDFLKQRLGYTLITEQYKNCKQKLKVRCDNGHFSYITFHTVGYKLNKCRKCSYINKRTPMEEVKKVFEAENYKLLSTEYTGARNKLKVLCPERHLWYVSLNKFKDRNQRCPSCSFVGGTSKMEKELFFAIKSYYPSTKKHKDRHVIIPDKPYVRGFDIDIFIPELKRGIEFDGTYFHSVKGLCRSFPLWPLEEIKKYHEIKDNYFKTKGIKLLHIKEEEWELSKEDSMFKCLAFLRLER